ncbi:MFS transporter [Streptomyces caniscabiei]|uniref:MFS transporter n=1 Tax=Streptomyces caniscabiei TaxID=2746961 RepID=UPI0029B6E572|nr:MFS transporter [Streptomyces caniscabiei]MDX2600295.1 MFS transporter [Streptomyces caniscabiei]
MKVLRAADGRVLLSDRLNRIPVMTRSHKRWLVVLAALLLVDMADLNTFAFAAPAIRTEWGMSVQDVATITSASFLGMFAGSIVGGRLADRLGRKRVIVGAVALFSAFSLLSAFAVGVADLAAYRVLTGVGLQAMTVVVLTYASEMFPLARRGRAQTWIVAISLLGVPAMAWFARWVVPTGPSAWRWIFVLGASGLVLIPLTVRWLPESVRWLQENGHESRAEEVVQRIEQEAREATSAELPPVVVQPVVAAGRPLDLFRGGYLKRTVVLCLTMSLALSGFYGYNSWVPTLLTEHGFSTSQSLAYSSVMSLATVPGALFALLFIDRVQRRTAVLILYTMVAGLMLVFGSTDSDTVLLASGLCITLLLQAATPCMYTYLPEIFPTSLRALGAGLSNGTGRLAVFGTTFLVGALVTWIGFTGVFLYLAGVILLAGLTIGLFGERTRGRSLEEITSSAGAARGRSGIDPAAAPAVS